MAYNFEEEAGRVLQLADRILKGYSTIDMAKRFRSLLNSHLLETLSPADRKKVSEAAELIKNKYKTDNFILDSDLKCRVA